MIRYLIFAIAFLVVSPSPIFAQSEWNVDIEAPGLHRITLTGEKIWIVGKEGIILTRDR